MVGVLLLLMLLVILELPIQEAVEVVPIEDHHQLILMEVQVVQVSWLRERQQVQELF